MIEATGRAGEEIAMPEKETLKRARQDKREGKSASTQAGEFVREEIHHIREGKHGARSPEQAIAIGLSKARRAGVELPPPQKGTVSEATRKSAASARRRAGRKVPPRHSRAMEARLKKEGTSAASKSALARHARTAARRRTASQRSTSARKAARTRARH